MQTGRGGEEKVATHTTTRMLLQFFQISPHFMLAFPLPVAATPIVNNNTGVSAPK